MGLNCVLGVDPSSRNVGWALIYDGRVDRCGVLSSHHDDVEERRADIRTLFAELLREFCVEEQLGVEVVACEDPQSLNIGTAKVLSTFRAMIEEIAHGMGLPYLTVRPDEAHSEARHVLGEAAQGIPPKDLMMRAAQAITGRDEMQQDEADAIFIALFVARNGIKRASDE